MLRFDTKANTLRALKGALKSAYVLDQVCYTVGEVRAFSSSDYKRLWKNTTETLSSDSVIVRSSAINEDGSEHSEAGKYDSVAGVCSAEEYEDAIKQVVSSFDSVNMDDQVFVQPMLTEVSVAGVAFTMDPVTGSPYYVINYDEQGSTSSVTSGSGNKDRLLYMVKDDSIDFPDEILPLKNALLELEALFKVENLDVEFAITNDGKLYILQVRRLVFRKDGCSGSVGYEELENNLNRIMHKIENQQKMKPFLSGKTTYYGVMPDWNPAEMIGVRPKPLAMSLYRELITDAVWAYQRDNYGYRNLRSHPLMLDFSGCPYIDIRVSFNSFVPAGLDDAVSEKLVNYYLDRLHTDPTKHDKVEFDIVFSCYTFDLPERIRVLGEYGFSDDEITQIMKSLNEVTNHIIEHKNGLWRLDMNKIHRLERRFYSIVDSDMDDVEKIYWLLEDCKRYGTLPFAGLARGAFIAVQLLKSMVSTGVITERDYADFMNDVQTVGSGMKCDFSRLSRDAFLEKYGHLRPGTYDIESSRYDEEPELYFDWSEKERKTQKTEDRSGEFRLSLDQLEKLRALLHNNGIQDNILDLMDFIRSVIEGREYGKFVFTRNVSYVLKLVEKVGKEKLCLSKGGMAYCDIAAFKELYVTTKNIKDVIETSIRLGKKKYRITESLVLPPMIFEPKDVKMFYYPDTEPNYISRECVVGEVVCVDDGLDVDGKILLIVSADPGYDWIFSHNIKGFITMWGGANSHMAIRAGELGVAAAIGVGQKRFDELREAKVVELDALKKCIRILRKKRDDCR